MADHFLANELVLGVPLFSPFGLSFAVLSLLCGAFQFLRAEDDRAARAFYARATAGSTKKGLTPAVSEKAFLRILEYGFALTENALFFAFLTGMTSGVEVG